MDAKDQTELKRLVELYGVKALVKEMNAISPPQPKPRRHATGEWYISKDHRGYAEYAPNARKHNGLPWVTEIRTGPPPFMPDGPREHGPRFATLEEALDYLDGRGHEMKRTPYH